MTDLDKAIAPKGPERLWACDPDDENEIAVWDHPEDGGTPYIRADVAQAAQDAAVAAALERAEGRFMDAVWDALKADANDLRKQQRILRAFRLIATQPQSDALADVRAQPRRVKPEQAEMLAKEMQAIVAADRWKGRDLSAAPPEKWSHLRPETQQFWIDTATRILAALADAEGGKP